MNKIRSALRIAANAVERRPTDAQKASGNYRKGHARLHGLDIAIENPKGGERSGVDKGGKRWTCVMPAHYGYVKRTEGKDGDAVDVYIGPSPESHKVFVVDQVDAGSGKFDEHKCCLGYTSKEQALADYEKAFSDGKAKDRIGSVTAMSIDDFKGWLKDGDTTKPMGRKAYASGGSVGHHMHNPKIASALRIAGRYAEGGNVPLSDAGPVPGQEWPDTYDPQGGADFLGMLKDTGTGIARAIAPPIPGYNHPTLSEGAEALRAKVADKSQGEVLRESLGEFAERVPDAVLQGSPTKAFPIAGRAISSALRTAGRTAGANPATAATAAGGLGLTGLAASTGEAGGEDPIKRLMASDPALQALDAQIKETERIARSSPKQQTLRNREMANQALPGLQKQFSERVAELTKGNLPWDKAHPEVAKWWPWIQVGAPMAAAMTMKGGLNYADRMATRPWRNAVRRAEDAFAKGDEKTAAFQSGKATEFLADEPSGAGGMARRAWNVTKDAALPTVAGAGLGAELSLLPHQHNRSNAPVGSEERLEAERRLAPENFFQTAAPGTIAGFLGGVTGAHLPNIRPGYRPAAETRNLQRRVLGEPGTQTPLPSGSLQSQALGSEGAQSLPRTQALQAETANPQIQGGSTSPRALEPPRGKAESLSADTPAESFSSSPQSSSALPPIRRKDKNGRAYWHDRMTGHRASKPDKSSSNKTPADEDPPFAHGGIVRSALRIARKFGGRIGKSGGLLKSDVPGRTDHIETSVKAGSFVLPADVVSHVGQNNTDSGGKWLDDKLKSGPYGSTMEKSGGGSKAQKALSIAKSKFAAGGQVNVPILAAGGEYIVGPEQVAAIGGGDLDRGHQILDDFVINVRKDHVATLQGLPPPQKD